MLLSTYISSRKKGTEGRLRHFSRAHDGLGGGKNIIFALEGKGASLGSTGARTFYLRSKTMTVPACAQS